MLGCLCASAGAQGAPAPAADLQPSKITLDAADTPLADVVASLAKQSGNAPLALPDDLRRLKVTLRLKDVPYWTALDALCDSAGLLYVPDLLSGGLRLDKAVVRRDFGVVSGPVAVKLEQVRRDGEYRVIRSNWVVDELYCVLRFFYEDRLPVLDATAEVVEARAPDGMRLFKTRMNGPTPYVAEAPPPRRPPTGTLVLAHARLPAGLDRITELTGVVRLTLGRGERRISVPDVTARGASASDADFTVTVVSADREGESTRAVVEVAIKPPRTDPPLIAPRLPYGFFLVSPDGKRVLGVIERVARNLRGAGNTEGAGEAAKVAGDVRFTLSFPGAAGPRASLVYVYPERVEMREVPFRMTDVPVGRPGPAGAGPGKPAATR